MALQMTISCYAVASISYHKLWSSLASLLVTPSHVLIGYY
uniref:Uncharacterized protein n=1 Tax=Anguilla anguilla TaxID=7936 RepID=A0A0E9U2Z1_ANGAN